MLFESKIQFFEQTLHFWRSHYQTAQPESEGLALLDAEKEQMPSRRS
jgi:hypothetical protein